MLIFTLVRHGQSEMNVADMVQSRTHGKLTTQGVQMAQKLGRHLKDEKFSRIYSSDLRRCEETTLNILKHSNHNSANDILLKRILRERDFGDLELLPGQRVREILESDIGRGHTYVTVPIPGGEDYMDVMKRCAEFFDEICEVVDGGEGDGEEEEEDHILVVSHGAWINTFLDYLGANPHLFLVHNYNYRVDKEAGGHIPNTARTKLEIGKRENGNGNPNGNEMEGMKTRRRIKFLDFACTQHLNEDED